MATSSSPSLLQSPFEFLPQPNQDADMLKLVGFLPGVKEFLILRQVHALEHATVSVLSKLQRTQHPLSPASKPLDLSGVSTERGFYLYGEVKTTALHQAVRVALRRLISGDWALAIHPRCGTNASIDWLANLGATLSTTLSSSLIMGFGLTPWTPLQITEELTQSLIDVGLLPPTPTPSVPALGSLLQQYVTTAIPFNLAIESIHVTQAPNGDVQHFVSVRWIDDVSLGQSVMS